MQGPAGTALGERQERHDGQADRGQHDADDGRVGLGAGRPLLFGNVRASIKKTLEDRAPIYQSVATVVVDTDETSPDEVAARIEEQL